MRTFLVWLLVIALNAGNVLLFAMLAMIFIVRPGHAETCIASVYSMKDKDQTGTRTASGIPLNDGIATIAHKSFPMSSRKVVRTARVTNTRTGASASFPVTDRGPYVHKRCVDLSPAAAKIIGIHGLGPVTVFPE